jgi:hypothetical protein
MVLLIVIAQALPVFLVGVMSGSKELLWLAAIAMTVFAAVTGSSAFFAADFLGIVIAVGAAYAVMGGGKNIT